LLFRDYWKTHSEAAPNCWKPKKDWPQNMYQTAKPTPKPKRLQLNQSSPQSFKTNEPAYDKPPERPTENHISDPFQEKPQGKGEFRMAAEKRVTAEHEVGLLLCISNLHEP
jgi:hypothetical protein